MGAAFVISVVPARLLLISVFLLAACSPQASVHPSLSAKASASPSATAPATPAPTVSGPLMLSAIQRLTARVGYVSAWDGTGAALSKTSDGGTTWQRLAIPAAYLTSLRFIDESVGWAAGFVNRENPQILCRQNAPIGVQPCKGVVLRTQDGGHQWETVLAIPSDGIQPIQRTEAVDGQRAWALWLDEPTCQNVCLSYLQRTTDGGQTWTTLLHANIASIRFASATRGWVALEDSPGPGTVEVRETSDGGTTWQSRLQTATGRAAGLDAATTSRAWLLTVDTTTCSASQCLKYVLFRTDDGGLTWSKLGNPKDFTTNCSGGHLAGPLFASTGRGWLGLNLGAGGALIGPGGILKSEDAGRTWRCATTPPNTSLVSAADPLDVWAAGEDRLTQSTALYTTEDAGATWHRLDLSSLR